MEKIEIKNLRSIIQSNELSLNNLNIFMGANSTGKSSILRLFQLFKQTSIKKKSGPILWYDREGVDFGSFSESINKNNKDEGMSFAFTFEQENKREDFDEILTLHNSWLKSHRFPYFGNRKNRIMEKVRIEMLLKENKFSEVIIQADNYPSVKFNIDDKKISVDNREYSFERIFQKTNDYDLIPNFYYVIGKNKQSLEDRLIDVFINELNKIKRGNSHIENTLKLFKFSNNETDFYKKLYSESNQKTIQDKLKKDELLRVRLFDVSIIIRYLNSIQYYNESLSNYFKNVIYIAPIRASAERYYRVQGLSVDEVDSMGSNVAMILYSMLGTTSYEDWQNWTDDNFGIKYSVDDKSGHTAIKVDTDSGKFNLADTGFGYSQLLPILLILWKEDVKKNNRKDDFYQLEYLNYSDMNENEITIVIEQPELHLHPAMQAKIADLLIKMIKKNSKIKFIIETHSVALIDRIGEHIEHGNYGKEKGNLEEKVNIFLVNPTSQKSKSNIVKTSYNENGVIQNWPVGFLSGGVL